MEAEKQDKQKTSPEAEIQTEINKFKNKEIGSQAGIEGAKGSFNIVKKSLKENIKKVDGTNQQMPKLNTYIEASKIFNKNIDDNKKKLTEQGDVNGLKALGELSEIIKDIQKLIDEKTLDTITDISKEAQKTKKDIVKDFKDMDSDKEVAYKTMYESNNTGINGIITEDQNGDVQKAYIEAKSAVDDILKVIQLKDISNISNENKDIKHDRLGELQTFLKTADFGSEQKNALNARINVLLPKADKSLMEKDRETKKEIDNKAAETQLGKVVLNKPTENASEVFVTGPYKAFEAAFNQVYTEGKVTSAEGNPKQQETVLMIQLLEKYNNGTPIDNKKTLYFGHAGDKRPETGRKDDFFAPEYPDKTPIIEFERTTKLENDTPVTRNGIEFKKVTTEKTDLIEGPNQAVDGIAFTKKGDAITAKRGEKEYTYDSANNTFKNTDATLDVRGTGFNYDKTRETYTINQTLSPPKITAKKGNDEYAYDGKIFKNTDTKKTENKELDLGKNMGFNGENITNKVRVVRGTDEHLQELKADKYDLKEDLAAGNRGPKMINKFDDGGNYKTFEKYLQKKDPNFIGANLNAILTDIKTYTPKPETTDAGKNINDLKNGYATVLTKYMVSNSASDTLLTEYLDYLTPDNVSYLGVDKTTQVANFNILVSSNKFKALTLDPKVREYILNLRFAIENTDRKSFQDQLKGGFKDLLKNFGGLVMNVIEFFGGKGAMRGFCSKFGIDYDKYFKDIEKMYDDAYALSDNQKGLLTQASKEQKTRGEKGDEDMSYSRMKSDGTGLEEVKIQYSKENIAKDYITKFKDKVNFKELDPTFVELAMKETKVGNSNVIISEKGKDGKIEKKINGDNNLTEDERATIVNYIIKGEKKNDKGNPDIRDKIKEASKSIRLSDSVYNTKQEKDENPKLAERLAADRVEAQRNKDIKGFKSANDIGIYFGAYLMKGSKDLKYTISQTKDLELSPIPPVSEPNNQVPETPKETLKFTDEVTDFDKDKKLTKEGAKKMIHNVIDMKTPPAKITVTRADGKTIANGTLERDYKNQKDKNLKTGSTYIDGEGERIRTYVGDKIDAVVETAAKIDEKKTDEKKTETKV